MHAVDHVFVFCRTDAPEQRRLVDLGLCIGVRREHRGQGTANVCFGFADAYLELLWLADDAAARDRHVKPLGLHERARWRETAASPFGVCVRPTPAGAPPPFAAWPYAPAWLPPDLRIDMACNSGVLGEPLLFAIDRPFVPFGVPHRAADRRLREVVLTVPDLAPMSSLREVAVPGLRFVDGPAHALELVFDGARGDRLDLGPDLPVVLRL
ncbi:MAG: VOC family protein [Planctomycetes bacterium]|nr:VOC family protein [Planctomycetota bacterium]